MLKLGISLIVSVTTFSFIIIGCAKSESKSNKRATDETSQSGEKELVELRSAHAEVQKIQGQLGVDKDPVYEVSVTLPLDQIKGETKTLEFRGYLLSDEDPGWNYRDYLVADNDKDETWQLWLQCLDDCKSLVTVLYDMSAPDQEQGYGYIFRKDSKNNRYELIWTEFDNPALNLDNAIQSIPNPMVQASSE